MSKWGRSPVLSITLSVSSFICLDHSDYCQYLHQKGKRNFSGFDCQSKKIKRNRTVNKTVKKHDSILPSYSPSLLNWSSSSHMEPLSSLNNSIPSEFNGHYRCGAILSVQTTSGQHYNSTHRKKSKVRLNDQRIPKPADINIGEKMLKVATPKEHPYSSHISQFAMFPSFCSPDHPQTGVRAASQTSLNPLIPNSALDTTVLSKTIGGPYRHEILETPMKTRKKAIMWPGQHGFLDYTKPLKEEKQVFYPTPPKTVLPNSKLRDWDLSLSERTSNMLKNLERALWVTSYQMHYTGSGPVNPLKIDDFKEKMSDLAGMNSHTAPLRERLYPVFVPSKPKQEYRRRQGNCVGRRTCSPNAAELLNPSSATLHRHRPQEIIAKHNEAPDLNPRGHSQSGKSTGSTEAESAELSQEALPKQQNEHKSSVYESRERERYKVQFDETLMQAFVSQNSQEANTDRPSREKSLIGHNKKQYFKVGRNVKSSHSQSAVAEHQAGIDSHTELLSSAASEQEKPAESRKLSCTISNPCILPRPQVLPGIHPMDRVGTVGRESGALSLLDLQNSFNKSKAHSDFNSSITHAPVNLRDNVVTGKKHDFYGINCYYLHG